LLEFGGYELVMGEDGLVLVVELCELEIEGGFLDRDIVNFKKKGVSLGVLGAFVDARLVSRG
jgi:hypothetical protein